MDGKKEAAMALTDVGEYLRMIPVVMSSPQRNVWLSYDAEADTLYVSFRRPSRASDSEMTDDDVIVRYEGDEVVGLTVLNASKRGAVH
jgi:uncharacterized protein YuzE